MSHYKDHGKSIQACKNSRKSPKTKIPMELNYKNFLTGNMQIQAETKKCKIKLNLTGQKQFRVFKNFDRVRRLPIELDVVLLYALKVSCKRSVVLFKILERTKYILDPKNYPIPHTSSKNHKKEKVSQIKEKGKAKKQIPFPSGVANLSAR